MKFFKIANSVLMLIALHSHIIDCFDTPETCEVMNTEITEATVATT